MAEKAAKRNAREMKAKADPVGDLAANQEVELKTSSGGLRRCANCSPTFATIAIFLTMSPLKSTEFCGSSFDRQAR
jgi:hypothetical protein